MFNLQAILWLDSLKQQRMSQVANFTMSPFVSGQFMTLQNVHNAYFEIDELYVFG